MSARLRDGSMVWFFGDTARYAPDGGLADFKVGSAAWAAARRPLETLDFSQPSAQSGVAVPVEFARPIARSEPCPATAPVSGMWPLSAVVQGVGGRDRVVLWMQNICLGSATVATTRGLSVGEWWYDPDDPPVNEPVQVRVLNQHVFDDDGFGAAAFADGDRVYVYGCSMPTDVADAVGFGPCRVARVGFDDVADPERYEAWTGSAWRAGVDGAPIRIARGKDAAGHPPGPFSVGRLPGTSSYVMAYTPWPGFVGVVAVRTAESPTGPWGRPRIVTLPDCDLGRQPRPCYAANLQPALSGPGRLAIGYYDPLVAEGPRRGSFLVGTLTWRSSR